MFEGRFPNRDELQDLRAKGVVASSPFVCRVLASLVCLGFLSQIEFFSAIRIELTEDNFTDVNMLLKLGHWVTLTVQLILIYLASFVFFVLLQTRFFFRPARIFQRECAFFSLSRGLSLLRFSVIIGILAAALIAVTMLVVGIKSFLDLAGQTEALGTLHWASDLISSLSKLSIALAFLLFLPVVGALVLSKVGFIFKHRTLNRRG